QLVSPLLVEAYLVYKPFKWLNFKGGQMIVAFSQQNMTQDRNLDMIERSQVVNALVARKGDAANGLVDSIGNQNGRDIGIQVSGSFARIRDYWLVDYTLQLLDGAGINTPDNNPSKDFDARLVLHPLKWISAGGSFYNGYDRFTTDVNKDQKRMRWGVELAVVRDQWSVKGEYIRGQEGVHDPTTHQGWYGQAGYFFIRKHLEGLFRYDRYDPNTAKTEISATFYDLGMSYYFNVWTKMQVYYSLRNQQGSVGNNNMFEAQLQLAF
ncbi:MAG TPA: porin, partial [Puia sp.]|nr:porin [Puia sp.]